MNTKEVSNFILKFCLNKVRFQLEYDAHNVMTHMKRKIKVKLRECLVLKVSFALLMLQLHYCGFFILVYITQCTENQSLCRV